MYIYFYRYDAAYIFNTKEKGNHTTVKRPIFTGVIVNIDDFNNCFKLKVRTF